MSEAFEDLIETFEFLDDWEDRYRHIIDMGKALPAFPEALRGPETKVDGCASQVWIAPELQGTGPDTVISFQGDSDAIIVRGLIAVLKALFDHQMAKDILQINAVEELSKLGLEQHLSAQRSNGLKAMIQRVELLATAAVDTK